MRALEEKGLIEKVAQRDFVKRELAWLGDGSNQEPAHVYIYQKKDPANAKPAELKESEDQVEVERDEPAHNPDELDSDWAIIAGAKIEETLK